MPLCQEVWNRLIGIETLTNLPAAVPRAKVEFAYDYMSRRVRKTVAEWTGSSWSPVQTNLFVYDGWNLIRETSSSLVTGNWSLATDSYV